MATEQDKLAAPPALRDGLREADFFYARCMVPARDAELLQIVDAATADAARRSGAWLKCRPGCKQCCVGVFAISQLDAMRLREGLAVLAANDPARAEAVRERARSAVERLRSSFPGDASTGILDEGDPGFEDFANEEPCPVLDPATGLCDLYAARPMTCRVFGPPLRTPDGLGVCELCFEGATTEEIVACAMHLEVDDLEAALTEEVENASGVADSTIVAWALVR